MFNFVSLLKYKRQMMGNILCVNLLRYAEQVYTIIYILILISSHYCHIKTPWPFGAVYHWFFFSTVT